MKNRARNILAAVLCLCMVMSLAACGVEEAEVNYADTNNPAGLDFNQSGEDNSIILQGAPMLMLGPDNSSYQPYVLADMPEISEDGLTITLTFFKGMKFHTGDEVTADDVLATFDHISKNVLSPGYSAVSNFESYEKGDETDEEFQVIVHMKERYPALYEFLSGIESSILSKKALDELGAEGFASAPVYYGARYIAEYVRNGYVLYHRNEYFFSNPENTFIENHGPSLIESTKYKIISDYSLQMQAVVNGTLDAAGYVPISYYSLIENNDKININKSLGYNQGMSVGLKADSPLNATTDSDNDGVNDGLALRRAIAIGLDRDSIAWALGNKQENRVGAYPAYTMYAATKTISAPTFDSSNSTLLDTISDADTVEAQKAENIAMAKELIESAGFKFDEASGFYYKGDAYSEETRLSLNYKYYPIGMDFVDTAIKTAFQDMGIYLELQACDFEQEMRPLLKSGDFELMSWVAASAVYSILTLDLLLAVEADGTNQYYYNYNGKLGELYQALAAENEIEGQQAAAVEINDYMTWDECRFILTFQPIEYGVSSARITGYKQIPGTEAWSWTITDDVHVVG